MPNDGDASKNQAKDRKKASQTSAKAIS